MLFGEQVTGFDTTNLLRFPCENRKKFENKKSGEHFTGREK